MGNLFKRVNFAPYIRMDPYKRGSGEWEDLEFLEFIFPYKVTSIFGGLKRISTLKMKDFAQISVMKQNLDYNPREMKNIFCDFLNYTSHCVYYI